MTNQNTYSATTIVYVRRDKNIVIAGDGQVTLGNQIVKHSANKLRKLADGSVIGGFAGSAADGLALFERLQEKLQQHENNLEKSAVELSKDWRTDQVLRKLEAMMLVADMKNAFVLTGSGDVLEPEAETSVEGVIYSIGSGSGFALAAGRALLNHTHYSAEDIATKALEIASHLCIHTNNNISILKLEDNRR